MVVLNTSGLRPGEGLWLNALANGTTMVRTLSYMEAEVVSKSIESILELKALY